MLAMKVTLRLLREAKIKDYRGTLESELNVALNKIYDKDFDFGVQNILLKPSKLA